MKTIPKEMRKTKDELVEKLREAAEQVTEAVNTFNNTLSEERAKVEAALEQYNEVLVEAECFRDEATADMDSYFSERSEKWQESDAGQNYEAWQSTWENTDFVEVVVDFPEEVGEPDMAAADELEQLPDDPE